LEISGFRREVDENCAVLGYYVASSGNFYYHYWLRNDPEERSSQILSTSDILFSIIFRTYGKTFY
jgi:hypothetical protein